MKSRGYGTTEAGALAFLIQATISLCSNLKTNAEALCCAERIEAPTWQPHQSGCSGDLRGLFRWGQDGASERRRRWLSKLRSGADVSRMHWRLGRGFARPIANQYIDQISAVTCSHADSGPRWTTQPCRFEWNRLNSASGSSPARELLGRRKSWSRVLQTKLLFDQRGHCGASVN